MFATCLRSAFTVSACWRWKCTGCGAARSEPWPPRLLAFCATGLPFIPPLALLLLSPTWHADGVAAYWELTGKLGGLFAAVNVYYPAVAVALVGAAALAAIYARRRGALRFHPAGWAILGVGLVTYMAMPRALFGAYLADQRLPIALAFMLIACFEIDLRSRRARGGLLALLVVLLAARVTEVQLVWDHLARITGEFRQSVETIKRGSRVLVVFGDRSAFKDVSDFEIVHAASLATIERSALVTTLFTVRGKQIMHARKEFQKYVETEDHWPPSLPYVLQVADGDKATSSYFWNDWPAHYDYVYILFATPGFRNPDRNHLGLAYSGDAFQLYRVLPTLGDQPPPSVKRLVRFERQLDRLLALGRQIERLGQHQVAVRFFHRRRRRRQAERDAVEPAHRLVRHRPAQFAERHVAGRIAAHEIDQPRGVRVVAFATAASTPPARCRGGCRRW